MQSKQQMIHQKLGARNKGSLEVADSNCNVENSKIMIEDSQRVDTNEEVENVADHQEKEE